MRKFIAMSDLHLGQNGRDGCGQHSLLSQIATPGPERERAEAVRHMLSERVARFSGGDPVTLILVGDVLDLSLGFLRDGLADMVGLIQYLKSVSRVVWVVGNHDHHIWTMHCEHGRCVARTLAGKLPLQGGIYQATETETSEPLTVFEEMFKQQVGRPVGMEIAYPAYRMSLTDNRLPPGRTTVPFYFTHGHLFEGLYTIISRILEDTEYVKGKPHARVAAVANVAVIEFIYWLLGETGEGIGNDGLVEEVYTDLQRGQQSRIRGLIHDAIDNLVPENVIPVLSENLEKKLFKEAATGLFERLMKKDWSSSKKRGEDKSQTKADAQKWAKDVARLQSGNFVVGHTHVGFCEPVGVGGAGVGADTRTVSVYNLGSWLVTPTNDDPFCQLLTIEQTDEELKVKWARLKSTDGNCQWE